MSILGTHAMRNRIIIAFTLIFSLFLLGSATTVYNLVNTSEKLTSLIGMHEIEDIRQDLFSSVLKVSSYVFASPEIFADHLDEIILNTNTMHNTIRKCNDCHHEPGVEQELLETQKKFDNFEQQLSYLITMISNAERRLAQQEEVYQLSTEILERVQKMVTRAGLTIEHKTVSAMNGLNQVYLLVAATLISTVFLSILVAYYLTRSITQPIDALVNSSRKIAEGKWGHRTEFRTNGEFQELIDSFNEMSRSLAQKREQEKLHLQKIQDTQKQLIEAEKLTALGTMAGGIAHDFNNILCGMIGHLNILAKQIPQDKEPLDTIKTIEKAGFRASDLVKQMLTFARQKPMVQKNVSLNKCVDDAVSLIKNSLDKRIELDLELDSRNPTVSGDAAQLEQIIINLCVNSRDAMPEGGRISLRTETFIPDNEFCEQHPDANAIPYVLLTVQDTGCGINEKVLPRIFDPFFTTKEVGQGTGLGLAMVYGIVKNHEGFCTISSTPGKGTTFKIYIPGIDEQAEADKPPAPDTSPANKTILIVDDEPMVVAMLKMHLESLGCRILAAANGQEGVDVFREKKDEIDLIILDINMPVLNGHDAYLEFNRIKPGVLVLISTGYVMNEETAELMKMGAQGILQKPYTMENINAKLTEIFSKANQA